LVRSQIQRKWGFLMSLTLEVKGGTLGSALDPCQRGGQEKGGGQGKGQGEGHDFEPGLTTECGLEKLQGLGKEL